MIIITAYRLHHQRKHTFSSFFLAYIIDFLRPTNIIIEIEKRSKKKFFPRFLEAKIEWRKKKVEFLTSSDSQQTRLRFISDDFAYGSSKSSFY